MQDEQKHEGVSIHAGFPNPAADKNWESLDLHQLLVPRPASTFLFRIRGNEWQDVGIFDGDIAVIDRALGLRKTDIAAWWDEQSGTFQLSVAAQIPKAATVFGVVTGTVHQLRKP